MSVLTPILKPIRKKSLQGVFFKIVLCPSESGIYSYFRPDGSSTYLQPDGASLYKRP